MAKFVILTKVVTGFCTFSYLNCWDPKAINGGTPKYSVSLIISKSDAKTIEKINAAIQAAYDEGQSNQGQRQDRACPLRHQDPAS